MAVKRVIKQEPVTLDEVKEILSSQKDVGELLYEQGIALDHAGKFAKLKLEDAQHLIKELMEAGLPGELASKLIDVLPRSRREIVMLFSKERFVSDADLLEKITAILLKYGES